MEPLLEQEITYLQNKIDQNQVHTLGPNARSVMEQGFRDGVLRDNRNFISRYVNPRFTEDYPEVERAVNMPTDPREAQEFINRLGQDTSGLNIPVLEKYKNAQVKQDRYGNPMVVTTGGDRRYLNAKGFSRGDIPRAISKTMGVVEDVAPYLGGAGSVKLGTQAVKSQLGQAFTKPVVTTQAATGGKAILGQGAIGLADESANQISRGLAGEEIQYERLATTPILAMAGEGGGQALGRVLAAGWSKTFGKPITYKILNEDGTLTKEALDEMSQSGKTLTDIDNEVSAHLTAAVQKGDLTEGELARYQRFRSLGIEPTVAQVKRDPVLFKQQNELLSNKRDSGRVGARLAEQEQAIETGLRSQIDEIDLGTTREPTARAAVVNKQRIYDTKVDDLYRKADEIAQGKDGFEIGRFYRWLKAEEGNDTLVGGRVNSTITQIKKQLKEMVEQGRTAGKTIDEQIQNANWNAADVETLRKTMNSFYDTAGNNPVGNAWLGNAKNVLDDEMFKAVDDDIYREARTLYSQHNQGMKRIKADEYDVAGKKNIVEELLADARLADGDAFIKKFITSNVYTRTDLQQLRRWMRTGIDKADGATKFDPNIAGSGIDGWRKVQKDVLEYIMEKAQPPSNARTGGSIDVVPFNSAKLDKVLDDIGMDKLKTIFSPEQVKYLRDLRIALKDMKSPVGSERSPSGAKVLEAVEYATQQGLNTLSRMTNVFGGIANDVMQGLRRNYAENAALDAYGAINNTRRNRAVEELTSRTTGLTGAIGAAGTTQTVGRDDG